MEGNDDRLQVMGGGDDDGCIVISGDAGDG